MDFKYDIMSWNRVRPLYLLSGRGTQEERVSKTQSQYASGAYRRTKLKAGESILGFLFPRKEII